ncbi:MAG: acyltransferase family protein [Thalassolituus sp.]|jgi:peptidoglycan/LPS O-acetylase OafA/YrhL
MIFPQLQINKNQLTTNKSVYRPEIDGLRAFAVITVIAFHAYPNWLKGGFIGVDVFFVISGFLITGHIFENLDKGLFSFTNFFGRRIRRILPALILVMTCALTFGWFTLLADEYTQLGKHVFGGAIFISNFIYWEEAISYLTNSNNTKPMLHLWSLAVEEQFYIVWPCILWFAWKRKLNFPTILIIVGVLSFYLNMKFSNSHPIETFFWPIGRLWELISGSLLAWMFLYKSRFLATLKFGIDKYVPWKLHNKDLDANNSIIFNLMSFFGFFLLAYGVIYINEDLTYPSTWALIPVLGAVLIIASGSKSWLNRFILMNPIVVWFGLISYPLYLWHWPILSFLHILEGQTLSKELRFFAILISILIAWLTYKFIEIPFRKKIKPNLSILILVFGLFTIGIIGKLIENNDGYVNRLQSFLNQNERGHSQIQSTANLKETSICRKTFKSLSTGLCIYEGEAQPSVILFGDSHALHYYKGLKESLPNEEVAMLGGGWGGKFESALNPLLKHRERDLSNKIYNEIEANPSIHTIVLAHNASENNVEDYINTFDYFIKKGKNVIYVIDIPRINFSPKRCFDSRPLRIFPKEEFSCSTPKDIALEPLTTYRKKVFSALKQRPSVNFFDTADVLCDENFCYAKLQGMLLYSNSGKNPHLSSDGELLLGRRLGSLISTVK